MNTINVDVAQIIGAAAGLLVIIAGIVVNISIFGANIPLTSILLFAIMGMLVVLSMFILYKD
ncbi:MAG TPA: hypothetical protein VK436_10740 [Methanocella sp.]|nr:hypothetical protein [Methanocella sp.]